MKRDHVGPGAPSEGAADSTAYGRSPGVLRRSIKHQTGEAQMKRLKIIGLALLALFALGALLASSATALEEGFLPLTMRHFNWLSKTIVLETHNKLAIKCRKTTGEGKFEEKSDHHGTGTLDFDECEALGFPAVSLGDKNALILVPVLFLICLINSALLLFGIWITPTGGNVHVEAGGLLLELKGAVIGHILPEADLIARTLWTVDFTGSAGLGNVALCTSNAGEHLETTLLARTDPNAFEEASEKVEEGLMQFLEAQKLMD